MWSFGIFFAFWYVWTKKNLATLNLTLESFSEVLAPFAMTVLTTGTPQTQSTGDFEFVSFLLSKPQPENAIVNPPQIWK
jgi:hypothetical protein